MEKIIINTQQPYPIFLDSGLLHDTFLRDYCAKIASEWVIITDENVRSLYAHFLEQNLSSQFKVNLISVPAGEQSKTRETKALIEDQMQTLGCGREVGILALGGGVVTDLAGFVAATYCRGVPAIYLPTTLLAMVDATVGGKTGVNTSLGKNLIGTFTQPKAVFIDTDVLSTLDTNIFIDGIVESIKHGLIADPDFFTFIDREASNILALEYASLKKLITRSIAIKKQIIEEDEFDLGKRALCNFGHTIGHAIESYFNYSIRHGSAVAMGLLVESFYSMKMLSLSQDGFIGIIRCLNKFGFSLGFDVPVDLKALTQLLLSDKKTRENCPHFVLLSEIGKPYIQGTSYTHPLNPSLIEEGLEWFSSVEVEK